MFYQSPQQWTAFPDSAKNFKTSPEAIFFATQNGLKSVEVFWDFDDPEYNVRLPIGTESDSLGTQSDSLAA